jgi:hypothetical protein
MHSKVLFALSFLVASISKEKLFFFLSPSDGEFRYPPSYPSLKQPLVETSRVFKNPVYMVTAHLAEPLAELLRDSIFF